MQNLRQRVHLAFEKLDLLGDEYRLILVGFVAHFILKIHQVNFSTYLGIQIISTGLGYRGICITTVTLKVRLLKFVRSIMNLESHFLLQVFKRFTQFFSHILYLIIINLNFFLDFFVCIYQASFIHLELFDELVNFIHGCLFDLACEFLVEISQDQFVLVKLSVEMENFLLEFCYFRDAFLVQVAQVLVFGKALLLTPKTLSVDK